MTKIQHSATYEALVAWFDTAVERAALQWELLTTEPYFGDE